MKPAFGGRLELNQLRYLQFFFRKQMCDESHCQIKSWKYTQLCHHIASQNTCFLLPSTTTIMAIGINNWPYSHFPSFQKPTGMGKPGKAPDFFQVTRRNFKISKRRFVSLYECTNIPMMDALPLTAQP